MKANKMRILMWMIAISLLSQMKLFSQGFQTKEVFENVFIVSNPDLGDQLVVQSEKGLLIFDSFWSERTAGIFKEEISKALNRNDFSYVINMVDRLDMIGGNGAIQEAVIVGHENIVTKYREEETVQAEIVDLIEMWREKEGHFRDRLQKFEAGSQEALEELKWMSQAKSRADELEHDFALVLPQISYKDRLTLDLGDCTMTLHWFGETGNYRGLTMAVIPEKELAILSKSIIFPVYHLAPYPLPGYGVLDVPRWIALLEEILEGENAVSHILLSDYDQVISRDLMQSHLDYIRKLWSSVKSLEAEGKNLQEIQDHLTFEKDFSFVKEMQVYKNQGDFWIRLQHDLHIKLFFLQGKNLASEIIKEGGIESLQASLDKIRNQRADLYFDEELIHRIAYVWKEMGHVPEAIEVFKLSAWAFPQSFNVHFSLAEAYMSVGDTTSAIKSYERSMELDPNNYEVKQALIELRN